MKTLKFGDIFYHAGHENESTEGVGADTIHIKSLEQSYDEQLVVDI